MTREVAPSCGGFWQRSHRAVAARGGEGRGRLRLGRLPPRQGQAEEGGPRRVAAGPPTQGYPEGRWALGEQALHGHPGGTSVGRRVPAWRWVKLWRREGGVGTAVPGSWKDGEAPPSLRPPSAGKAEEGLQGKECGRGLGRGQEQGQWLEVG